MLSPIDPAWCVLRISEAVGDVSCHWTGAALVTPARLCRIRVGDSDSIQTKTAEGVVFPVLGRREYFGKLELDKWTLPHAVEILATTVR